MVLRLDNPSSAKAKTLESLTDGKQQTVESFTVIGSTPVIATGKTVIFKGGRVDVDTTGTLTLQEPPTDDIQSDWVAAASPRGLALIPLKSNAKANFIANGGQGESSTTGIVQGLRVLGLEPEGQQLHSRLLPHGYQRQAANPRIRQYYFRIGVPHQPSPCGAQRHG